MRLFHIYPTKLVHDKTLTHYELVTTLRKVYQIVQVIK